MLTVEDNGIGIPQEMLTTIFDMFIQVDQSLERRHGGLGIGLTLVKRIVEMHGGSVAAESAGTGKGSTFTVRLPRAKAPSKRADAESPVLVKEFRRRVLIIDDNKDAADTLKHLLQGLGHEALAIYSGLDAVEVALQFKPEIVLLDIGMPGMNGYEVAQRLRQISALQEAFLVSLTGCGEEAKKHTLWKEAFNYHLVKPVGMEVLQQLFSTSELGRHS